jgi:hypothetical protein
MNEAGLPLNGSPFAKENNSSCKFQDASCKKKNEGIGDPVDR